MIKYRTAQQCGKADYGWLQARYTFSFGHYFDPHFLDYGTLRVLNQEVLAPNSEFKAKTYPHVDVVNLILRGEATYLDNMGRTLTAKQNECLLISPHNTETYIERNSSPDTPLTRIQLWLNACPQQESIASQKLALNEDLKYQLLASPSGDNGSLMLRQNIWLYHINLAQGDEITLPIQGQKGYLQSIKGGIHFQTSKQELGEIRCGDGAFIQDSNMLALRCQKAFRGLFIDIVS
ncbi:pirin family protein [Proteus mirabilis]|uniref:pirin family protein n=1 Tax=Proteus mirabilis TaxID=584 RepID=UPI0034DD5B2A